MLAFASYVTAHCVLSLSYAHQIVKLPHEAGAASSEAVYQEHHSFRKNMFWVIMKGLGYSADKVVVTFASAIGIFLGYSGITAPMIIIAWAVPALGTIMVIGRIVVKYYIQLPDAKHVRILSD